MNPYPAVGAVVAGRYRIDALLGEGGMGAVFRATDQQGRGVALKFAAAEMRARPGMMSRFANEAVAASKIQSDYVVKIYGVEATEDGTPFIVMELLEGTDLDRIIDEEAPLDPARAVHFTLQILRALQVAHAAGVIHRDLKPSNCYVVKKAGDEHVKLIDFGITKILGDDRGLTQTSTTMGTPGYMSPEQAKSTKSADARSDLYSVGVILYELLTKKRPFDGESHNEIVVKICTEPPVPIRSQRADLPSGLAAAVEHAIVKIASGRFPNAAAFAAALKPFADARSAKVLAEIEGGAPPPASEVVPAAAAGKPGSTAMALAPTPQADRTPPPAPAQAAAAAAAIPYIMGAPLDAAPPPPTNAAPIGGSTMAAGPLEPFAGVVPPTNDAPHPVPHAANGGANGGGRVEQRTVVGDVGPLDFGNAAPIEAAPATQRPMGGVAGPPPGVVMPPTPVIPQGGHYEDDHEGGGGNGGMIAFVALLLVCGIGAGVYFMFFHHSTPASTPTPSASPANTKEDEDPAKPKKKKKKNAAGNDEPDDEPDPPAPDPKPSATEEPTKPVVSPPKPKPTTTPSTTTKPTTTPSTSTKPTITPSTTATTPPTTTAPTIVLPSGWILKPSTPPPSGTGTAPPPPPPTATTPPPPPPPTIPPGGMGPVKPKIGGGGGK